MSKTQKNKNILFSVYLPLSRQANIFVNPNLTEHFLKRCTTESLSLTYLPHELHQNGLMKQMYLKVTTLAEFLLTNVTCETSTFIA